MYLSISLKTIIREKENGTHTEAKIAITACSNLVLSNLNNIKINDVYTVGDSINDIDMLQKYNGHKMLFSHPQLLLKNIPTTKEVHTLIKKINK